MLTVVTLAACLRSVPLPNQRLPLRVACLSIRTVTPLHRTLMPTQQKKCDSTDALNCRRKMGPTYPHTNDSDEETLDREFCCVIELFQRNFNF